MYNNHWAEKKGTKKLYDEQKALSVQRIAKKNS